MAAGLLRRRGGMQVFQRCHAWCLALIAPGELTVKKTMIRFRHKQMTLLVPVIQIIHRLLNCQLALAMGRLTTACGGMLDDGQGNDTVDDSRGGNAAAVCVSVTGCRLGPEVVARCACGLCHLGC